MWQQFVESQNLTCKLSGSAVVPSSSAGMSKNSLLIMCLPLTWRTKITTNEITEHQKLRSLTTTKNQLLLVSAWVSSRYSTFLQQSKGHSTGMKPGKYVTECPRVAPKHFSGRLTNKPAHCETMLLPPSGNRRQQHPKRVGSSVFIAYSFW